MSLILIRHSITRQQPEVSSHDWTLTDEGRARCKILAGELRPYKIDRMYCSPEAKARVTAELTAAELGIAAPQILFGVEETHRHTAPYTKTVEEFQAKIRAAMLEPDKVQFGEEAFSDALTRFRDSVENVTALPRTVAIVTHGTIMLLYMAAMTGLDVFEVWQSLDMPAYAVFELSDMKLTHFAKSVAG